MSLFHAGASTANECMVMLDSDSLRLYNDTSSTTNMNLVSTAVYRDPSAWYHFLVVYNSTQATSTNRVSMYVNGVQITSFSTSTYPAQNQTSYINSNIAHQLGERQPSADLIFDGYLAEVNFVDGQALTPSSFGTYDTNGVWQPIKYSGSFGTNGFYLNFGNTTSTTTLGYDTSGNSNNWTTNNISLTAGSTYDSMTDSPTVSSATVANYCTLNPLDYYSAYLNAPTQGNLYQVQTTGSAWAINRSTIGITSGKWYAEVTQTGSNLFAGVISGAKPLTFASYGGSDGLYAFFNNGAGTAGYPYTNGTSGSSFTIASGDVIGLAYDYSGQTLAIYRNNSLQATVTGIPNTTPMFFAACFAQTTASTAWNFGQRPFSYSAPTGFNALNTYNLPTPTIANGAQYMAATLYTGNGSSPRSITNGGNNTIGTTFAPDLVWIKDRGVGYNHVLQDSVRGTGASKKLSSNLTVAEGDATTLAPFGDVSAFNSNGFSLEAGSTDSRQTNASGDTYVGWQWQAGSGSSSSNTNGSITSTVSANTTAGFSIVTATLPNSSAPQTIGHGLGVAPNFFILKYRSQASAWSVYHSSVGNTGRLDLSSTGAVSTSSTYWNNTSPTSSVITLGSNFLPDASSNTVVIYCFSAVSGYSAFGSYTGNGSTDGPFVYTGFRPRYVLVKETVTVSNWNQWDSSRNPANLTNLLLRPNSSGAESVSGSTDIQVDFLANGFKIRGSSGDFNTNGELIIYAAFAENPFNSSRAR
jgi:hypothetical protein